jgi:hypothetical protein
MEKRPKLEGKPLKQGHPLYDEKAAQELATRCARIESLRAKTDEDYWREGDEFLHIRDKKLYRQAGYASMSQWVVKALGRSRPPVAERMRFAETFSLQQVREHGRDRLDLALAYASLTVAGDEAWALDALKLHVPKMDGAVETVPFKHATTEQLEAAVTHQRSLAQRRDDAKLPEADRDILKRLEQSLQTEAGPLAQLELKAAGTGVGNDTTLRIAVRLGDLESLLVRLTSVVAKKRLGGR